jgi:hypothetical protein
MAILVDHREGSRRNLEDHGYLGMLLTTSAEHDESMENDRRAVKPEVR